MVQFIDLSIGLYSFVICKTHLQEVKAWHPYNPVSYHHKARLSNSVILFLDNYSWNKLHVTATLVATPTLKAFNASIVTTRPLCKHVQVCTLSYLLINAQDPHLDVRILIGVTIPTIYGPVRHKKKKKMMMMR